ncbi:MAG TPA: sugar ABC transporter substrate-binding protein [Ruminiclostridium sp.]
MKKIRKSMTLLLCLAMTATLIAACGSSANNAKNTTASGTASTQETDKKSTLTYTIWDVNQEAGMKAIAAQFTKENPNITVKAEVTSSDQYWTKLEAAAVGGSLPDVFWMHPNNFIKYAKGGQFMDLTSKVASSSICKTTNFPADLVTLSTFDGKLYGIPKDYDTIGLWYNKALFDEKGISYPDDTWDWSKLKEVAKQLTDPSKGIYGFAAYPDAQQVLYDFMYQNGGYPINEERTKSGYDSPESIAAMKYATDFSLVDKSSPTQAQLSNTSATQYFESGKVAMSFFGSWMTSEFYANEYTKKNCDVAVLPKGKNRASMYNGLSNVVAASTKNPDAAWKFVEYLGSEEANKIQSDNGSAIPAFTGLTQGWIDHFQGFNVKAYTEMLSYAVLFPNNWEGSATFSQKEANVINPIFSNQVTVEQGCKDIAAEMDADIKATE